MGFEQTKQIKEISLQLFKVNVKVKHLIESLHSLRNNDIILNSLCLAVIFIITRYFFIFLEWSTIGFSLSQMVCYSIYSIPICYYAPIIIEKLNVRNTLCGVLILSFILYIFEVKVKGTFIHYVSIIITPILTELSYIVMVSYIISFSTKDNIGLSIGILIGAPYIVSNYFNLTFIQKNYFIFICLIILALSMVLLNTLGFNIIGNGSNSEGGDSDNGFDDGRSEKEVKLNVSSTTITSVLGSNKFLYFIPAAIFIGMINDYSAFLIDYGSNLKYYDKIYFIAGIFGGIAAILFGALADRINYKKRTLMQISLFIGIASMILDYLLIYLGGTNISVGLFNSLFNLSYVLNSISSSSLIVFIYIIGSLHFKSNSLSLVSSIRLFQAIGSIITYFYLNWFDQGTVVSIYLVPAVFTIGFVSLIIFESKDSKNINPHHNNKDFLQLV